VSVNALVEEGSFFMLVTLVTVALLTIAALAAYIGYLTPNPKDHI
jgi:hypothetical protein